MSNGWRGCVSMGCLNDGCLFRVNDTPDQENCECTACPNRYTGCFSVASNRTLTAEEIKEFEDQYRKCGRFVIGGLK